MTLKAGYSATIDLKIGDVLLVTADEMSQGTVWLLPRSEYGKRVVFGAVRHGTTRIGPFPYPRSFRVEAVSGTLEFETKEAVVADLERATERIKSATIIAKAINEGRQAMSALDRIKAKAREAKNIVPGAIRDIESDLDSIIAEKKVIDAKRAEAAAPHIEAIAGIKSELDGLKSALDILSNGGPELDPLPESENSVP